MPFKLLKWWMERVASSRGSTICAAACLLLSLRVSGKISWKMLHGQWSGQLAKIMGYPCCLVSLPLLPCSFCASFPAHLCDITSPLPAYQ